MALCHAPPMHITVEPSILYFDTPVALVSTVNDDGTANLAPVSSLWWLGWNCMVGLGGKAHTAGNLLRRGECVLNLPSEAMAVAVNYLARLTGSFPVPPHKAAMGYRYEKDKFGTAGFRSVPSELVGAPRVEECPIQLEAVLETTHPFGQRPERSSSAVAFELRIVRAHVEETLLVPGRANHIDPDRWRPLLMSFCQFYGLGNRFADSTLAQIPEEAYRPARHLSR